MATELYLIAPPDAAATAFGETLRRVLAETSIAALLLRRGGRSDAEYRDFVGELVYPAQEAGCAVLIEGEPRLAIALGVDGLHTEGSDAAVKAAIATLKPDLIVGAGGIMSRHDAMTKGELELDYIMFGPLSGAIDPASRELARWWAETMQIPSVLSDPEAEVDTADSGGCEFLAVGECVLRAADPAAFVAAIAARLETLS